MGNHKFKLSDMIPNAWFYKLRDMNTTKLRNQNHSYYSHQPSFQNINRSLLPSSSSTTPKPQPRNISSPDIRIDDKLICHASSDNLKLLDPHFPYTSQRKSTKKKTKRKTVYVPSPRKYAGADDPYLSPQNEFYESPSSEFEECSDSFDRHPNELIESSFYSTCNCKLCSDIIIDVEEKTNSHHQNLSIKRVEEYDLVSELELPPILTKPTKHKPTEKSSTSFKNSPVKNPKSHETQPEKKHATKKITRSSKTSARKPLSRSGKVRIRGKFSGKRSDVLHSRKSNARAENKGTLFYSDSFAIVKASFDPEKDFRDSMLEMIVDYNIRASKDLEELLACYLSLNSNQYHDLIIRSFMQIWFNFPYCSKKNYNNNVK